MTIPNECVVGCAYRDCTSETHSEFCPCSVEKMPSREAFYLIIEDDLIAQENSVKVDTDSTYSNRITTPLSLESLQAAQANLKRKAGLPLVLVYACPMCGLEASHGIAIGGKFGLSCCPTCYAYLVKVGFPRMGERERNG